MFQHATKFSTALVFAFALTGCGGGGADPDPQGQADLVPMKLAGEPFYWNNANGHSMQVVNQGDAPSPATNVTVVYRTFSGDVVETYPIPALDPGAISPPIVTTLPEGRTTSRYTVAVDADTVVSELDESNNEATEEVLF